MSGNYSASSGPIAGSASAQNIFSVENPLGATSDLVVMRASIMGVSSALFTSPFSYLLSRATSTPAAGTPVTAFRRRSADSAPNAVFRASPTATPAAGPAKVVTPGVLLGVAVTGSYAPHPLDLLNVLDEDDGILLAPGEGLLIHATANSANWTHFADFRIIN